METKNNRGGYREGAGRKKSRPTTVLRIPECYQTQVKALIKFLDDDKLRLGGAYELSPAKNIETGKRMVLSFVLDEYFEDRHSLCDIYN